MINSPPCLGGHGIQIVICYLDCDTAKREPVSWCGHADHPAATLVARLTSAPTCPVPRRRHRAFSAASLVSRYRIDSSNRAALQQLDSHKWDALTGASTAFKLSPGGLGPRIVAILFTSQQNLRFSYAYELDPLEIYFSLQQLRRRQRLSRQPF